jgi:hypothetical protein
LSSTDYRESGVSHTHNSLRNRSDPSVLSHFIITAKLAPRRQILSMKIDGHPLAPLSPTNDREIGVSHTHNAMRNRSDPSNLSHVTADAKIGSMRQIIRWKTDVHPQAALPSTEDREIRRLARAQLAAQPL